MNQAHHDWADSMSDWAESHPITQRAHRALPLEPERMWTAPQGRIEQGWPARRCTAEPVAHIVDRLPEKHDLPEPLPRKDLVRFWAVAMAPGIALLGIVGFAIWVRFGHVW